MTCLRAFQLRAEGAVQMEGGFSNGTHFTIIISLKKKKNSGENRGFSLQISEDTYEKHQRRICICF